MRYPVILADPPVPFETWGKRPGGIDSRAAAAHYHVMTWRDLFALGPLIRDVAAPDCVLFVWLCQPLLRETLAMARRWGFRYKTKAFAWCKLRPEGGLKFHVGMGYWTRANTEDVLLFTRGEPSRVRKDVYQMIATLEATPHEAPAVLAPVGRHSAKPAEVHDRIERLVAGPYLELFGRRRRDGWTVLGNEIDGKDIRDALRDEVLRDEGAAASPGALTPLELWASREDAVDSRAATQAEQDAEQRAIVAAEREAAQRLRAAGYRLRYHAHIIGCPPWIYATGASGQETGAPTAVELARLLEAL